MQIFKTKLAQSYVFKRNMVQSNCNNLLFLMIIENLKYMQWGQP